MKIRRLLLLVFLAVLQAGAGAFGQANFPLTINVNISRPYPTRLSDFTDYEERVFIEIFNSSTETYQINLTGKLEDEFRGISISTNPSNPPTTEITVYPGNNPLGVSDFEDLFDPDHLLFTGVSLSRIRADEALPEGEYRLCVRAYDALNPDKALSPPSDVSGCSMFNVTYVDEPEIITPEDRSSILPDASVIPIQWIWNRPVYGSENVTFTLRIIELDPPTRNPKEALLSSTTPELFIEEGLTNTYFDLSIPDDVVLETGKYYAIQVIAKDETGSLTFKNGGRSLPVVFQYHNPIFAVPPARWLNEQGTTYVKTQDVRLEFEIPISDETEIEVTREVFVFEIPEEKATPYEIYKRGNYIIHDRFSSPWSGSDNPGFDIVPASSLKEGEVYGALVKLSGSNPKTSFINNGESEILIFQYGMPNVIPKPEWITENRMKFERPEEVSLRYRVRTEEGSGLTIPLDGKLKYFEVFAKQPAGGYDVQETGVIFNEIFDDRSLARDVSLAFEDLKPGHNYGAVIEISSPVTASRDDIEFENEGRSDTLFFSIALASSVTDVVLLYPGEGDRIPFSFFPLVARYQPFNPEYQHWKSEVTIYKDGTWYDNHVRDLRWPGGSREAQSTLAGLSDITESESQNIAVYKSNEEHSGEFERGSDYRWEVNVKLYNDVSGSGSFIEFNKTGRFSRGMGPSSLSEPQWGAVIAPDSAVRFEWITAEAPDKLFPITINQATRTTIDFFNGVVDEKWVLEVSRSESFDSILFHEEGRIGLGMDYLSGDYTEEQIREKLYRQLRSSETFTPSDTGYYYWRVKWLKNPAGSWDSPHYESSQVRPFWVGIKPPPGTTTRRSDGGCESECLSDEIPNTSPISSLSPGDVISVGKFEMTLTSVNSSGGRFSGQGEIIVPFLMNVKIRVSFENIRVNTDRRVYEGKVTAVNDVPSISIGTNEVTINGRTVPIPEIGPDESEALNAVITDGERLVSGFSGDRAIGMPIGLDNEIDGVTYVIGITEMTFEARKAYLGAVMRFEIPSLGNYIPAFGAKNVCFTPTGLGDEKFLFLARDWTVTPEGKDIVFSFSSVESGDTTRASYIQWDCNGFKCAAIRGNISFSNDVLLKENDEGNILEGERVRASFGVKTCRGGNWIAELGIEPFQVKGLDGWGFRTSHAYLDFSDIENPPSMSFPEGYDTTYLHTAFSDRSTADREGIPSDRLLSTWKGFYLSDLMVFTPPDFEDGSGRRASFGVENMIIDFVDGGGVTVSVVGNNVIDIESGKVDNLAFSIDTVRFSVIQSRSIRGAIKGKIGLPVFAEGDRLHYSGLIVYRSDTTGINFHVEVKDTLNIPMWAAKAFLAPESEIGIEHRSGSEGEKTYVYADLTGGIDINAESLTGSDGVSVPAINFKGIRFEHLRYNSDGPTFDIQNFYVAYASPQKSVSGFPVNIDNIGIDISMPRAGLTFDLTLVLADGSFSAEAGLGIYGRFNLADGKERFSFDGVSLESIEIDQRFSGISLQGRLDFYRNDAIYGNGLRGYVSAVLPMDIAGSLTVQFGTKRRDGVENPTFNTADYFPYWYVDGLVRLPEGLTIFSGFAIYGFGGGVYYRMRPDFTRSSSADALLDGSGSEPSSGVRYIPDWNTLGGMRLTAVMGTQPSEEAFNMDVSIEMAFNSSGGIGMISIDGEGYVMVSFEDRSEAKVRANVHLAYVNPGDGSKRVEGHFVIIVDYGDILRGAGSGKEFVNAEFLVEDETWYYYMGKPDDRGGLAVNIPGLRVTLDAYLMMGHGIPRELPPLPEFISRLVYGPGRDRLSSGTVDPSSYSSRERSAVEDLQLRTARGFAFGTSFHLNQRFEFAIFYAELEAMFGFDVLMSKDEGRVCLETGLKPGINEWYAMGQIYAGLRGEMGVYVDLFFIEGEFPIIELAAAIAMRGGMPNPVWMEGRAGLYYSILGGLVEGRCNFKFQVGEKCSVVDENPLSNIEFIADIYPADGSRDVDVFAVPNVSFNLPVNQLLEIPAGLDDEPDKVRVFKPFIKWFVVTNVQDGSTVVPGSFVLDETHTLASFSFHNPEAFEAFSRYRVQVTVQAYELFPDGSRHLVKDNGRVWQDNKTVYFVTGPRPKVMDDDQIAFTYPIKNQAYFLQNEAPNGRGLIRNLRTQAYLFEREIDGREYDYVARFTPLGGGDVVERYIRVESNGISFALPHLENQTYYSLQIVRKPSREEELRNIVQREMNALDRTSVLTPIQMRFVTSDYTAVVNLERKLPGEVVRSGEELLYHYYFKTSKFNTLREKLADVNLDAEFGTFIFGEFCELSGQIPEQFDEYDIRGYYKNGIQRLGPLVEFYDPFNYDYHNSVARPWVYSIYEDLNNTMTSDDVLRRSGLRASLSSRPGIPPTRTIVLTSGYENPIQQWVIERMSGMQENNDEENAGTDNTGGNNAFASAVAGYGLSSLFAGVTTNIREEAFATGDVSYALKLSYLTSTYVRLHHQDLKRSISRILSERSSWGIETLKMRLQLHYRDLYSRLVATLLKDPVTFNYIRGTYGVGIRYRVPTLNTSLGIIEAMFGGSSGNINQTTSSSMVKTFNY